MAGSLYQCSGWGSSSGYGRSTSSSGSAFGFSYGSGSGSGFGSGSSGAPDGDHYACNRLENRGRHGCPNGMQSDYAYAEMFSQSRWSSRGWGPKRIKAALVPKGISGAHIERALQHVFLDEEDDGEEDDEDEEEMDKEKKWGMSKSAKAHLVSQATKQWLRSGNASLETRKARMVRWLQYRGFNWDVISPILRQLQSKYPAQ